MSTEAKQELTEQVLKAFSDVARLDFRDIPYLGCCEEYEEWFVWYRNHTWLEFKQAIPSDQFDPISHGSLTPIAFHYFSPGVLLYVVEYCDFISCFEWAEQFVPLKGNIDRFREAYLPFFSLSQRNAVASCLRYANQQYFHANGYYKEEWERAVKEIWQKHTLT